MGKCEIENVIFLKKQLWVVLLLLLLNYLKELLLLFG